MARILVIGLSQEDIRLKVLLETGFAEVGGAYASGQEQGLAGADYGIPPGLASAQQISTVEVAIALHRVVPSPPASSVHTVKFSSQLTGVEDESLTPRSFALHQNYPNPFNPSTTFSFSIPHSSLVTLKIYDLLGREVATLVDEQMKPGNHETTFDATGLASGVYFYKLQAGEFVSTKKLLLMK